MAAPRLEGTAAAIGRGVDAMPRLDHLKAFAHDDIFHVVVESPRGSAVKLKYSAELGAMTISRPLNLGVTFSFDWGFVPSTQGADGDPIDALVYWDVSSYPGVVIPCRALAVVKVDQRGGEDKGRVRNDRVVAIPTEARREKHITDADDLPARVREELDQFFLAATALEGKDARILSWGRPEEAVALIRASMT
jgi:inorganic pyrophosphatase